MNFKELECSVCKNSFVDGDDIVVCPECGAPYHRTCYIERGKCIYEYSHGTGTLHNQREASSEPSYLPESQRVCPKCSHKNHSGSIFCNACGFDFNENYKPSSHNTFPGRPGDLASILDPMGGVDPREKLGGIPAGEIAKYVRTNTPYYMVVFKSIMDLRRSKFNFGAFLFSGAWFLYRKIYGIGIVITIFMAALILSSAFIEYTYSSKVTTSLLYSIGVRSHYDLTPEKYSELLIQLKLLSLDQQILFFFPSIVRLIELVVMLFSGIMANRCYLKDCSNKIKKIKLSSKSPSNYMQKLDEAGGVNFQISMCLFFCYIIIVYLPRFIV